MAGIPVLVVAGAASASPLRGVASNLFEAGPADKIALQRSTARSMPPPILILASGYTRGLTEARYLPDGPPRRATCNRQGE
jgi:hypothetical protein